VEKQELAVTRKILSRYPKARAEAVKMTKELQEMRRKSKTAQKYGDITSTIREHKLKALKDKLGVK